MLHVLITVLHIVVCIALILIVLLQTGKGADMGAAFGGGSSQTLFGSSGPTGFLSKGTTVAAVAFMCTSLILAIPSGSVVERAGDAAPAAQEQVDPAAEVDVSALPAPESAEQAAEAVPAATQEAPIPAADAPATQPAASE